MARAMVCGKHATEKCVICGKWPARTPAFLCSRCSFGSGKEKCSICDEWPARKPAMACDSHRGVCPKCGKRL